jgi:DNA-binding NtrC family response regulator
MANEKVLVVDDDNIIRHMILRYLQQKGYFALAANDGQRAYELIKKEKFDVLIVDIIMPKMGGIDFIEKVRELGSDAVIIVLSSTDNIEDAIKVMREGKIYDFLRKTSTDVEQLDLIISKALAHRSSTKKSQ